jgi:hypothetical protein
LLCALGGLGPWRRRQHSCAALVSRVALIIVRVLIFSPFISHW